MAARLAPSRCGVGALRLGAVLLLPLGVGGCYSLTAASIETLQPGHQVRVTLAPARGPEISQVLGASDRLEGELSEIVDGAFFINVPSGVRQEGFRFERLHQTLRIERSDVLLIERKQLDPTRTALVVGAAGIAVAAVVLDTFAGKTGGDPKNPPVDIPSDVRIPSPRMPPP